MFRNARRRWSQRITEESHALALEPGVSTLDDPYEIARALQRARLEAAHDALRDLYGKRRGADPFRPSSEATADRAAARAHPPRTSGAPGRRRD